MGCTHSDVEEAAKTSAVKPSFGGKTVNEDEKSLCQIHSNQAEFRGLILM